MEEKKRKGEEERKRFKKMRKLILTSFKRCYADEQGGE